MTFIDAGNPTTLDSGFNFQVLFTHFTNNSLHCKETATVRSRIGKDADLPIAEERLKGRSYCLELFE